jgi:uncharacterized protein
LNAASTTFTLVDGDGHIVEDRDGLIGFLPKPYREEYEDGRVQLLFPPLDHFHGMPMRIRGGERKGGGVGPSEWLDFISAVGLAQTVLYPTWALSYGKIRDRDWAAAVCRAYNEWLAETYLACDERFQGMAIVPIQDPVIAAQELRYAVESLHLKGAVLPANGLTLLLGAKEYWPLYEAAEELQCAITVHGGCHDGFGLDGMNVYAPVHGLGHPFGQLIQMGSMVFNGIFERWPGLRVGYLEGGVSWLLMALERFDESFETHVPFNVSGEILDLPEGGDVSDYIVDLLRTGRIVIGCEGGEHDTEYVVKRIGKSPFFYSSDFPHEVTVDSCRAELQEFAELDIPHADRVATLSSNAQTFYRL